MCGEAGDDSALLFPCEVRLRGCRETVRRSRLLNVLQGESETPLQSNRRVCVLTQDMFLFHSISTIFTRILKTVLLQQLQGNDLQLINAGFHSSFLCFRAKLKSFTF